MRLKVVLVAVCLFIMTSAALGFSKPQSDNKPECSIASTEHSFGAVKPGTPLTYSFVIKNTGKASLEIKNVAPSCGCTTSSYDKIIAPGAEGKITLAVEKTDAYKGEVTKMATVSTNDPAHASFQLTLKATFVAE
jgi:archaellum component FlaG (FlaF/FlaG flagellin family)